MTSASRPLLLQRAGRRRLGLPGGLPRFSFDEAVGAPATDSAGVALLL